MKKVLVTVPNRNWISRNVVFALLELWKDPRYLVKIAMSVMSPPLENHHNSVMAEILETDIDWWLILDDDTAPHKNPLDLIELDKDIIGIPYPIYNHGDKYGHDLHLTAFRYNGERYSQYFPRVGLQQVDAVGGGCLLVSRRVVDHADMQKGAWLRKYHPNGTVRVGNDIAFCERAREAGFEIWAHFDYPCEHLKEVVLRV